MQKLTTIIQEWIEEQFVDTNCFIVDIKVADNNTKIQVFVDCDENITIDGCVKLSRWLEKKLEENNYVPEKYKLEVSSPGIGKPFKLLRQYQKNVNKTIEVLLSNSAKIEGILKKVDENGIVIDEYKPVKGKNKRKVEVVTRYILFSDIKYTKKAIKF